MANPPHGESPIRRVIERVPDSLLNIAPERAADLRNRLTDVRFALTDSPEFGFCATQERVIEVPEQGMELVWAASYLLWRRYLDYQAAAASGCSGGSDSSLRESVPLFRWAIDNQRSDRPRVPWPSDFPVPTGFQAVTDTDIPPERIADEIAMCAAGWLLHHELAHVVAHDSAKVPPDISRNQETAADKSATDWLLDHSSEGVVLVKRGLDICTAVFCLIALEVEHLIAPGPGRTHPPAAERVVRCLAHPKLANDGRCDLIAAIGLRLLIDLYEIPITETQYSEPSDCLADYCFAINTYLSRN